MEFVSKQHLPLYFGNCVLNSLDITLKIEGGSTLESVEAKQQSLHFEVDSPSLIRNIPFNGILKPLSEGPAARHTGIHSKPFATVCTSQTSVVSFPLFGYLASRELKYFFKIVLK